MAVYEVYTKDTNEPKSAVVHVQSAAGAETIAATIDADEVAIVVGGSVPAGLTARIQRTVQELYERYAEITGKLT